MCGIAGAVVRPPGVPGVDESTAAATLGAIRHRGPDACGEYRDRQVWFGFRRLSILDVSPSGNQPMATANGRYVICYNGETYNFRELSDELALGPLRSRSDTEVVLRAFERLGVESFRRLNGMFAFALYDAHAQKLWLVRDRLGIKPLYYRLDGQGLVFGSEIKAIAALDNRAPTCDLASLHEWLFYGNALGGRTLVRGVRQLLPGHYLEMDIGTFASEVRAYWTLERQARPADRVQAPIAQVIGETRRLLEAAVRRQLVSDVPVGVFLSGGVDSSAITAFAAKHYEGRLATYSAGFDDLGGVDERPKARRVAAHFGTVHHEIQVDGGNVADVVERMVHHHDMPFADAANIPLHLMATQLRDRTKVVLQGDGGDELFGGYRRYVTLRAYRWLRLLAAGAQPLDGVIPGPAFRARVRRYLHAFATGDVGTTMALLLTAEDSRAPLTSAFAPPLRGIIEESDAFARYRACQRAFADHDVGNRMSLVDMMIVLPDVYLEKVDRATMAASLEVRVPFLDHDLVDYVVRIPGTTKMPWGRKKWLLKQALAGVVPDDVLYGPKTGFDVPFGYWLRSSLKPLFFDHLERFGRDQPGVLDARVVMEWYRECEAGREDRSPILWKLLNLMVWCNNAKVAIAA
jgi:asparagine synthase (glutamine-hydrolysing)